MKEKYNKKGNLVICNHGWRGCFTKGKVYEIRVDGTNRVRVVKDDKGYANGWCRQKFDLYELFTIGSKWVTKCNITTMCDNKKVQTIMKGECIELTKETSTYYMFEDGYYVLYKDEAKLLLEQYIEPEREMTLEEINEALGYKVKIV